jgi:folate-binding protein YgfZ
MGLQEEYGAAREGAATVDLLSRGVLEATGPDRHRFLQGMLSNDVSARQGEGCLAAFLDVKGHVLALMRVLATESALRLELAADRIAPVEQALNRYRVAAPVRFQAKPFRVLGLVGPRSGDLLRGLGAELPGEAPESHRATTLAGRSVLLARASDLPGGGFVVHIEPGAASAVQAALVDAGAAPLGDPTLDALRVEAGRPWYGTDVTAENLLHEAGLVEEYCSTSKGCYIGQEVVARLEARGGNVSKRLRGLRLGAPASARDAVTAEGKEVGRVTTAALSPALGPIAMAYIHRSHAEPDTGVEVGGTSATVVALPALR